MRAGDIISHAQMCLQEGVSLQKGMNYRIKGANTVILMSTRKGAPYEDQVLDNGTVLIYEGHDVPKNVHQNPKSVDQPKKTPNGKLTENGKFHEAAVGFKKGERDPEHVRVYEKIKDGIWVFNGIFKLTDSWTKESNGRLVFKFRLEITDVTELDRIDRNNQKFDISHDRMIPTKVKIEVWNRDKGRCVSCGSTDNLHFDHILPFSKGGTSLKAENIQLLCARHNLSKSDKII